jgi:hypothetical protein
MLQAHQARVFEDRRTIFGDVLVKRDAVVYAAQHLLKLRLAPVQRLRLPV